MRVPVMNKGFQAGTPVEDKNSSVKLLDAIVLFSKK